MKKFIVCDKCGYRFLSEKIKLRFRTLDKDQGVTEQFFRCPKCKAKYTVFVSSPEIRRLIMEHKKIDAFEAERKLRDLYRDKIG